MSKDSSKAKQRSYMLVVIATLEKQELKLELEFENSVFLPNSNLKTAFFQNSNRKRILFKATFSDVFLFKLTFRSPVRGASSEQ